MFSKRSEALELIDLGPPHYSAEEYKRCLDNLNRVGHYLGGDRASYKALNALDFMPESILDVGCGGGGFTKKLSDKYPRVKGIDTSLEAISHARATYPEIDFARMRLEDMPDNSYDVVIATLVCHHLSQAELPAFLKQCARVAKKAVIINDLHRHFWAWASFSLIAPLLFRDRLITYDGRLSIKRAFKRKELEAYGGTVSWHWPFRWIMVLRPS